MNTFFKNYQYAFHGIIFSLSLIVLSSFSYAKETDKNSQIIAPILSGMGEQNFSIQSSQSLAIKYANQAIALTYGFNHLEAGRSFKQVSLLEPELAISYWGQALVLGPNINAAMDPDSVMPAYNAIQTAIKLKGNATTKEQGLIDALSVRYSTDLTQADRVPLDNKYADAMRTLSRKYPQDPLISTLLAESLMILHAWDYWEGNGKPKEWTPEILTVLEAALKYTPNHAGLNHYYIHAVEASRRPERALKSADMLEGLVPGAGHLVHMPSHIYIRTGLYQKGVEANEKAILVDNDYIAQCRQQGIYPVAYVPHNRHFLWAMATMQGNSQKAITAANHMAMHIDQVLMEEPGFGTLQHYWVTPWYAYVRFGKWQKILNIKQPKKALIYPLGVWHYARGIAHTALGDLASAKKELVALQNISTNNELKSITVWEINDAYSVINIAALVLEGEIAGKEKQYPKAIAVLKRAINLEDSLNYNEPNDWHASIRLSLGAVLIDAKEYSQAEIVYLEDLATFPENMWALYGLYQTLKHRGANTKAEIVKKRFKESMEYADIQLNASRIL